MPPASSTIRRLTVLVAVAAVLLAACTRDDSELGRSTSRARPTTAEAQGTTSSTTPAEYDPGSGFPAGWRPPELDWERCSIGIGPGECATLAVPLDWDDPEGDTVDLALARIPAEGDRIGSLLSNPGGPGASGIEFLEYGVFSAELSERFDIVSWDPRGVGDSTAVTCDQEVGDFLALDPSPDDPAEQQAVDEAAAAVSSECGETDGDLLPHLGTADVARDLEAIRLALGGEPLNYIGFSYGTHIGLQYAEFFGENVRAMTLDGVVDPALGFEEFLMGQALAFEQTLTDGNEACASAGTATCGIDDLLGTYEKIAQQVETDPLPGGPNGVGPAEVAIAATFTGYVPDGWILLGGALAAAEAGDGSELWDLASEYLDFGSYGAYAGVVCTDTSHPEGAAAYQKFADEMRAAAPHFGSTVANEMLPCATWAAAPNGEAAPIVAPDAPPILVVGNTGDPATPLENAETVADTLDDGHLLVVDMDGHTAYGTDLCATGVIDDYMIDLELPEPGTRC